MELTRSIWSEKQYNYLSKKDSELYDKVKDSDDPKDKEIKRLILEKAKSCYGEHQASRY